MTALGSLALHPAIAPDVTDTAASDHFHRQWEALLGESDNLYRQYQSPEWWSHMTASGLAATSDLAIIADARGLAGIAPVRVRTHPLEFTVKGRVLGRFPLRAITLLGGSPLARPEPAVHDALYARLLVSDPSADCLYFHSMMADGFAWSHLRRSDFARRNFLWYAPDGVRAFHYLTLPDTFQNYLQQQFRSKKRYNLNRQLRLLRDALGDTHCERIDSVEDVPKLLDAASSVMPRAWQRTLSPAGPYEALRFPERLRDLATRRLLRSYVLIAGGTPRALVLGYQFRGVYHYAEIAYDETIAKYSPGTSLLYLLIKDLFEHDRPRHVNFGIGDAEYKRGFSNVTARDASVILFRKTPANRARMFLHRAFTLAVRAAKPRRIVPPSRTVRPS